MILKENKRSLTLLRVETKGYTLPLSPTVFYHKGYRFFFFSREEKREHVHVYSPDGEAKFWLEPSVLLARELWLVSRETLRDSKNH